MCVQRLAAIINESKSSNEGRYRSPAWRDSPVTAGLFEIPFSLIYPTPKWSACVFVQRTTGATTVVAQHKMGTEDMNIKLKRQIDLNTSGATLRLDVEVVEV